MWCIQTSIWWVRRFPSSAGNLSTFWEELFNSHQCSNWPRITSLKKKTNLLTRVDATPVTRKQKLHLYRLGICLRITWDLTVSEFPLSWLEKNIDSLVTRYLKRWSGLARPADPSRLYLPQKNGGLGLSSVSLLYQKMQR